MKTVEEIKAAGYKYHHSASRRGYLSRKGGAKIEEYKGRFGEGYAVITPRFDTTQYVTITYYVK